MVSPLELRALGSNQEVSKTGLWAWRIISLLIIVNVAGAMTTPVGLAGGILGAGGVLVAILFALGESTGESEETAEEASAA